jgi:hypothetical protein
VDDCAANTGGDVPGLDIGPPLVKNQAGSHQFDQILVSSDEEGSDNESRSPNPRVRIVDCIDYPSDAPLVISIIRKSGSSKLGDETWDYLKDWVQMQYLAWRGVIQPLSEDVDAGPVAAEVSLDRRWIVTGLCLFRRSVSVG